MLYYYSTLAEYRLLSNMGTLGNISLWHLNKILKEVSLHLFLKQIAVMHKVDLMLTSQNSVDQ